MSDSLSHTFHCEDADQSIIDVGNGAVSRHAPPCLITIFGATGDLTHRKLIPALYDLVSLEMVPDNFAIVGYGRSARDEV